MGKMKLDSRQSKVATRGLELCGGGEGGSQGEVEMETRAVRDRFRRNEGLGIHDSFIIY